MSTKEFYDFARDFMDCNPKAIAAPQPKTTDAPQIKMFMLQMMNAFALFTDKDGLRWHRTFKHKASKKHYKITILLEETDDK